LLGQIFLVPDKVLDISMNNLKCRNYCFTLNNYNEEDIPKLLAAQVTYITFQKEIGANGTPHLQGNLRTDTMKSCINGDSYKRLRAHIHMVV